VKGKVSRGNSAFSLKLTIALTEKSLSEITVEGWRKSVSHTKKIEKKCVQNDGIRPRHNNCQRFFLTITLLLIRRILWQDQKFFSNLFVIYQEIAFKRALKFCH